MSDLDNLQLFLLLSFDSSCVPTLLTSVDFAETILFGFPMLSLCAGFNYFYPV